eukprot:scaffold22787_cov78-Skeletonema_dohrnii-CCMP3373.AAC.3
MRWLHKDASYACRMLSKAGGSAGSEKEGIVADRQYGNLEYDWTVSSRGIVENVGTADDEMGRKSKEPSRSIGTIES